MKILRVLAVSIFLFFSLGSISFGENLLSEGTQLAYAESLTPSAISTDKVTKNKYYIKIYAAGGHSHYFSGAGDGLVRLFDERSAYMIHGTWLYPVYHDKTLLGIEAAWTDSSVLVEGSSWADLQQWFVGADMTRFWGTIIGQGPFTDASLGLVSGSAKESNIGDTKAVYAATRDLGYGFGAGISSGYAFPIGHRKRWSILAELEYRVAAYQDGFVFGTFFLGGGVLF